MTKASQNLAVSKGRVERMPYPTLFGDVDRMFEDFINRRWLRPFGWESPFAEATAFAPSVDVIDRDEEVVVRAEMPGYKKEDIEVVVSDTSLTIKGETKAEKKEEKGDYYCREISHGAFSRTVSLPTAVDDTKAKATMTDGVLELTLPKVEKSERHTITIS